MGHDLSKTVTIEDLQIGKKAVFTKTISESDVYIFGGISGDLGPHHINEEYGKTTRFGARVVQGMLTASMTCAPLTELVAPGGLTMKYEYTCNYSLLFQVPVRLLALYYHIPIVDLLYRPP